MSTAFAVTPGASFCKNYNNLSINSNNAAICKPKKPFKTIPAAAPLRKNIHIRACDPSFGSDIGSSFPEDGKSLFAAGDLALLQKRISLLRNDLVVKDRNIAHNWKNGTYKTSVVACVPGENFVRRVAIDAPLMACGTADGSVCIFHLSKGDRATSATANSGQTTAIAIKGAYVASVGSADQIITVWNVARYRASRDWSLFPEKEENANTPVSVAGSDNNNNISVGSEDGPTMPEASFRLAGHTNLVTAIEIDAGNRRLYSASLDGTIRVWDLTTGNLINTITAGEPILCMKHTAKDYILVGCASGRIRAYQASRGLHLLSLNAHNSNITALDFHDGTQTLATGDADGCVKVWSFDTAICIGSPPKHAGAVMALSVDETKVVSASRDGTVGVNDIKESERLYTIEGYTAFISSLAFDSNCIYADGTNNVIACHSFDT